MFHDHGVPYHKVPNYKVITNFLQYQSPFGKGNDAKASVVFNILGLVRLDQSGGSA